MIKKNICLILLYFALTGFAFGAANYTFDDSSLKYNSREAYNYYSGKVNEAVYKSMPRSFSYINREPQFAVRINKTGKVEKAWIMVSSGSKGYDKKVVKRMEETEFPSFEKYVKANNLEFRYKIRKQTKLIPIPIIFF